MPHNGGILQINLARLQFGGDHLFINHAKNAQSWSHANQDPTKHNDDGWPTEIYAGGQPTVFNIPSQTARPGNYIIDWEGDGTINLSSAHTIISGSLSGLNGRVEVSTSVTQMAYSISVIGSPPVTNIRCYHVDDEALIDSVEYWHPQFISRLQEGNPGTIRFLNSFWGNASSVSHWADRTPLTHYSYAAYYRPRALYAGVTTNSGDDYSVAFPGFVLTDKARLIVKFNATSSGGSPRLNVEGTGLKLLKDILINQTGGDTILFSVRYPHENYLSAVTYDADLDCYIMDGGSTESNNGGFYLGIPPELIINLCNRLNCHLSIPMPRLACDPMTDWLSSFAQLAKDTLNPGLLFKVAGPNETWNTATAFAPTYYALEKQKLRNGGVNNDWNGWYGRCISKMGDVLETIWPGGKNIDYDLEIECWTSQSQASQNDRFEASQYVTETGNASDAPKLKATSVSITGYWNASKRGLQEETDAAADYAAAVGAAAKAAVVDAYMTAYVPAGLTTLYARYQDYATYAQANGLKLVQYEGDYSPDFTGTAEVNTFRKATKGWPGLYRAACQNYQTFIKVYGGEFPSRYRLSGPNDAWGIFDEGDLYLPANPVQWRAFVDTSNGVRPFRLTTS